MHAHIGKIPVPFDTASIYTTCIQIAAQRRMHYYALHTLRPLPIVYHQHIVGACALL